MADNLRVLDCRVDELAANLNALAGDWASVVWNFYERIVEGRCPICAAAEPHLKPGQVSQVERRVTVVLGKILPHVQMVPAGPDIMKLRRN